MLRCGRCDVAFYVAKSQSPRCEKNQPPLWKKFHPGFSLCLMLHILVNVHEFHTIYIIYTVNIHIFTVYYKVIYT
jgi:hypothetical protein